MKPWLYLIVDIIIFCCWLTVTLILTISGEDTGLIIALTGLYLAINLHRMSKNKGNDRFRDS